MKTHIKETSSSKVTPNKTSTFDQMHFLYKHRKLVTQSNNHSPKVNL